MKRFSQTRLAALGLAVGVGIFALPSCKLDRFPEYELSTDTVYNSLGGMRQVMAKLYSSLMLTGQKGGAGAADISFDDEGFTSYTRQLWKAQEVTTDEAVLAWGDAGAQEYNKLSLDPSNTYSSMMYSRIFFQVAICNDFLRNTTDSQLKSRGIGDNDLAAVKILRAEARFLRALSYWHALDMFGNVPFVTEADPVGAFQPQQKSRADLFNYVEAELKEIDADLLAPRQNEYPRADKAAAWMVLAKLYQNARVYTGQERNTDCLTYCNRIIGAGYQLQTARTASATAYSRNFLADNNTSPEVIFAVASDGQRTQSYGGTTFMVHASFDQNIPARTYGVGSGWAGLRTRPEFVALFGSDTTGQNDQRASFVRYPVQRLNIRALTTFGDGYAIVKYRNVTSGGVTGSDPANFVDTDYPMFRLADVYLMYAEAVLRGGQGGDANTALGYVNALRDRAFGNNNGRVTLAQMSVRDADNHPTFILDERGRELYWEGHRRTDLIRYDRFTTAKKLWQWKGGTPGGRAVSDAFNLFPLPFADLSVNQNLKQNPGY